MDIKEIVEKMKLEDKISLLMGKDFWSTKDFPEYGIPELFMCDGPTGLRKQERENGADMLGINNSRKATSFPSSVTTASTWDVSLLQEIGKAIGQEAKDQKVGMVLGPGTNIKRNPLCGRNFEYFSEDPILSGELATAFIKGVEEEGIACSLKHFACNSQEKNRFTSNSVISDRALREIYLKAFEIAVKKAHPSTLMSAYPKLNGVHCSDNKLLLTDILRYEWGFDGMVVTDWGGMNNRIEAIKAGNDLSMPGGSDYMEKDIKEAVEKGELTIEDINKCVERIVKLALKEFEVLKNDYQADYQKHHEIAVDVASQGAVLLKNDDKILPLNQKDNVLFLGNMFKQVRYQGSGSSHVNPMNLIQPIDAFGNVEYVEGCDENGDTNESLLMEIKQKAKNYDKVVIFVGLPDRYESEGFDRDNLKMPDGHIKMIKAVNEVNENNIVVLLSGAVVDCEWENQTKAILYMGLAGEGCGEAAKKVLFGEVNPSGKLAETWPLRYEDVPSSEFYCKGKDALYMEDIFVGYRYYEKANVNVRYPFGYGLSYTEFNFNNLKVDGNKVSLTVKNIGNTEGKEVVQLYIGRSNSDIYCANKELKRFTKVNLQAGESKEVSFDLNDEDFSIWDNGWKVLKGEYRIEIGNSSQNIILEETVYKEGEIIETPTWQKDSWYQNCSGKLTLEQFEKVLGRKYEEEKLIKGKFTLENTVEEMKDYSLIMKIMYKAVEKTISKGFDGKVDYNNPDFRMLMNSSAGSPLRSMQISGGIKGGLFKGLVEMANGHYLKGIMKMIKG